MDEGARMVLREGSNKEVIRPNRLETFLQNHEDGGAAGPRRSPRQSERKEGEDTK